MIRLVCPEIEFVCLCQVFYANVYKRLRTLNNHLVDTKEGEAFKKPYAENALMGY